jgi:hypothetical protein
VIASLALVAHALQRYSLRSVVVHTILGNDVTMTLNLLRSETCQAVVTPWLDILYSTSSEPMLVGNLIAKITRAAENEASREEQCTERGVKDECMLREWEREIRPRDSSSSSVPHQPHPDDALGAPWPPTFPIASRT